MTNSRRTALMAMLIVLISGTVYAQKFNIQKYTVNDGLPSSNILDVVADQNGYLWYATTAGVIRFDGKNYVTYTQKDGLKDAISYVIFEDKDGGIWTSTEFGGLAKFEQNRFVYPSELNQFDSTVVNFMYDTGNRFWIGTEESGLITWDRQENVFDTVDVEDGLPSEQIWDVYFHGDDAWISTAAGIGRYHKDKVEETYTHETGVSGYHVFQSTMDKEGNLWMATDDGITILNADGSMNTIYEINGVRLGGVFAISKDGDERLWIGTERRGLFLYEDGSFNHVSKTNGLSSNYIYRFKPDRAGNMWVATDGDGVSVFRDMNLKSYDSDSELDQNQVFSLHIANDGAIWMGSQKGLHRYKEGKFTQLNIPEELFSEDEIWKIEEYPNGNLVLLTYSFGLIEFDGKKFFNPEFPEVITDDYIYDILIEEDGGVWISTFGNLHHYKDGKLETFPTPTDEYWKQGINVIFQDSKGLLWLGTEAGVAIFSDSSYHFFSEKDGLVGLSIYDIAEDTEGNIWVGSNTGISYLKRAALMDEHPRFNDFYSESLRNKESIFLQFDHFGGLWQGTNSGLNYFDVEKTFSSDSLNQFYFPFSVTGTGTEFNGTARAMDKDGNLWFGSNSRGLVSYQFDEPSGKIRVSESPKVYLREIYANNELIYQQSADTTSFPKRTVPFKENDLEFRFNAIDYLNPKGIRIKYRLAGYDTEWEEGIDISEIRYTNVPAGSYILEMVTQSNKSPESKILQLAKITVRKPFYLSIPFFGANLLFLIWIIGMYVNYRISRIEKKELQTLVDIQTEELTKALTEKEVLIKEIHHRVKNNLAVVSGLLELQSFRMPAGESKAAIVESKMRVIAISKIHENLYQNHDLANVDFKKFISELITSNKAVISSDHQKIEVIEHIEQLFLNVNIGVPLALIINELVSNCFKHAFKDREEGVITITFSREPDKYLLIVTDDGFGADSDLLTKKSSSLGITLIKSLIEQLRGTITYKNEKGSKFIIEVPAKVDEL